MLVPSPILSSCPLCGPSLCPSQVLLQDRWPPPFRLNHTPSAELGDTCHHSLCFTHPVCDCVVNLLAGAELGDTSSASLQSLEIYKFYLFQPCLCLLLLQLLVGTEWRKSHSGAKLSSYEVSEIEGPLCWATVAHRYCLSPTWKLWTLQYIRILLLIDWLKTPANQATTFLKLRAATHAFHGLSCEALHFFPRKPCG